MESKNSTNMTISYSTISELQNYLGESKLLFDYIIEDIKKQSDKVELRPIFYKVDIDPETKIPVERVSTYYDIEILEEYFEKQEFILGQKFHVVDNSKVVYKVYSLYFTDKWFLVYKELTEKQYQYRIFEFEHEYYLKNLSFSDVAKAVCLETGSNVLMRLYWYACSPEEVIGFFNSEHEDNLCRTIPKVYTTFDQAEDLYHGVVCMGLPIGLTFKGKIISKIHKKILRRLNKMSQEKQQ
ncbi:MAG: hypothetical protein EB127_24285, partial [Alphaproteobacteria bacterium]|nr:hypothetical protein [Alphaproteobacteria bacterium]